jgi:cytoskeletal protein RodZ
VDPAFEQEIQSTLRFDGPALQKIRLYKKVTLDHLCEETRISRTYLAAIETDDHAALPAPVFVRGFLVQMSRLLGIDTEKVAKSYLENMKSRSGRS